MQTDDCIEEGTVVLAGDPLPGKTAKEMNRILQKCSTTQELVDIYAKVTNKFFWIADCEYDYEEGTETYQEARNESKAWYSLMKVAEKQIITMAAEEGMLAERQEHSGLVQQLETFMKKYGYRDGRGWWVRN